MNSLDVIRRVRTVVVGLGRIGFGYHCVEVVSHPEFELVGVVDPMESRLVEARDRWGVPGYATLEEALQGTRPALVVIASPTRLHAAQALLAFAAGAHVFCDKPVAGSVQEFRGMMLAADAAQRRFVAYQPARFRPELEVLKGFISQNLLGPIQLIKHNRTGYERRQDWQAFRKNGGGMLNNYGSHCVDEILWLLGQPIESVYCRTRCVATAGDAEDLVKALLTCADGTFVDLEISQASALSGFLWEVYGANGAAFWHENRRVWQVRYFDPKEAPPLQPQTALAASGRLYRTETLPWHEMEKTVPEGKAFDYYAALGRHLLEGDPAPVSPTESLQLLEIIERCHASAESGKVT